MGLESVQLEKSKLRVEDWLPAPPQVTHKLGLDTNMPALPTTRRCRGNRRIHPGLRGYPPASPPAVNAGSKGLSSPCQS